MFEGAAVQITRIFCRGGARPVGVPAALHKVQALLLAPYPPVFVDGKVELRERVTVGTLAVAPHTHLLEWGGWANQWPMRMAATGQNDVG